MIVNFTDNCTSEASRWSFSVKLREVLRTYHNTNCAGMSAKQAMNWRKANFNAMQGATSVAINNAVEISREGGHWNPQIPDHVSTGNINYPANLDQDNEGSRASFLIGLERKLSEVGKEDGDIDLEAVREALTQARLDAKAGTYWTPSLGDIVDG